MALTSDDYQRGYNEGYDAGCKGALKLEWSKYGAAHFKCYYIGEVYEKKDGWAALLTWRRVDDINTECVGMFPTEAEARAAVEAAFRGGAK